MKTRIRPLLAAAGLVATALATPAGAQTTISTLADWNGSTGVAWGIPGQPFAGQTVTVPGTDNVLQSFSFWLANVSGGGNLLFEASVEEWTAGVSTPPVTNFDMAPTPPGAVLFQSGPFTAPGGTFGAFQRYDFPIPGGLTLTPGATYLLALRATGTTGPGIAASLFGNTFLVDAYAGGNRISRNVNYFRYGTDAAFEAVFTPGQVSPVPEPSTVALVAAGVLGLLASRPRRRPRAHLARSDAPGTA